MPYSGGCVSQIHSWDDDSVLPCRYTSFDDGDDEDPDNDELKDDSGGSTTDSSLSQDSQQGHMHEINIYQLRRVDEQCMAHPSAPTLSSRLILTSADSLRTFFSLFENLQGLYFFGITARSVLFFQFW